MGEELVDGMAQMFAEMDTDKDGSLSLAEYIGSLSDKEDDGIMSADELADEDSGMSPDELADEEDDDMSSDELADREMSPDELADMHKEMKVNFDKLDEDKSGKLSQAEMAKAWSTEGDGAMDEKQMVMEELDKDKDGFLSLEEFQGDAMDDVETDGEELKKGLEEDFRKADKNNDSKLSTEELQAMGDETPSEE